MRFYSALDPANDAAASASPRQLTKAHPLRSLMVPFTRGRMVKSTKLFPSTDTSETLTTWSAGQLSTPSLISGAKHYWDPWTATGVVFTALAFTTLGELEASEERGTSPIRAGMLDPNRQHGFKSQLCLTHWVTLGKTLNLSRAPMSSKSLNLKFRY